MNTQEIDKLIEKISHELARVYALGWKSHQELIGSVVQTSAEDWAKANAHMFVTEAVNIVYSVSASASD